VREAAVVAIPDATYGEGVAAFVIPAGDEPLTVEDAKTLFAELGLAPQKAPTYVEMAPDLPRTASGKVQKFALRDRLRRASQEEEVR
jgi:acyl-coenzyme A synthetase/AMP-(fatty) acid ligase